MDCNLEAERVHYVQDGDLLALPGNPPKRISMNHIRDIVLEYSDGSKLATDTNHSGGIKVKEVGEVDPMNISYLY